MDTHKESVEEYIKEIEEQLVYAASCDLAPQYSQVAIAAIRSSFDKILAKELQGWANGERRLLDTIKKLGSDR